MLEGEGEVERGSLESTVVEMVGVQRERETDGTFWDRRYDGFEVGLRREVYGDTRDVDARERVVAV